MIERIEDRDGRIFFQDKDGKAKYARVIGGLGWPGIKPGFAVVLGEDFDEDPSLKIRHVKVFAKIEEENIEMLFQKCLGARDRYQVEDFFGNDESKGMMEFLYDFSRK
jgi:hypothetical protein